MKTFIPFFSRAGNLLFVFVLSFFLTSGLSAQNEWTVSVWSDSWGDATTWMLLDSTGVVILSGGTYGNGFMDVQTVESIFSNVLTAVDTSGPVANFEYTPIVCLGQCYSFENTSIGGEDFFWTFEGSDTPISQDENPSAICYLDATGVYNVTLTAINEFGSASSITQQITVVNPPEVDAGPDQIIAPGTSTNISATGGNGTGNFTWQPADQVDCFTCSSTATNTLLETTVFTVFYQQSGGCEAFDSLTIFTSDPSSIDESLAAQVELFPNPARDMSTLMLPQG